MNYCRIAFIYLLMPGFILSSCAQHKSVIKNTRAYYTIIQPGTIRVDPNGNEVPRKQDTLFVVYAEVNSEEIVFTKAVMNQKTYKVVSHKMESTGFEAGFTKETGEKIIITPTAGCFIYRLVLEPSETQTTGETLNMPSTPNRILLIGEYKGKPVRKETNVLAEINGHASV
jgi:hypothetical protein